MPEDAERHDETPSAETRLRELGHRLKNTLAMVQVIARQSFRDARISDEAWARFDGRLAALAVAHDAVWQSPSSSVSVARVMATATGAHDPGSGRVIARGPDVSIGPRAASALGLALHELATNATKHGALSQSEGKVTVIWTVTDRRLQLVWRETEGPPVAAPSARGFGLRLLERGLAAELGGGVRVDFRPEGLVCEIEAAVEL